MLQHDSPLMEALSRAADYVICNLLCLLCCLPVVTIGAAQCAKYAVGMKIVRGEEPSVARAFFAAFRSNFRQATLLWLLVGGTMGFLGADWFLIYKRGTETYPFLFLLLLGLATYLTAGVFFSVFPLLARFQLRNLEALKGAAAFSLLHLPRVLLALFVMVFTYVICAWYLEWALAVWLLSTGTMLYYNSRLFVKVFKPLEESVSSGQGEETV